MNSTLKEKSNHLEAIIRRYKSVLVAFSGGVDSTLLAYICKKILGTNVLLITATSSTYPKRELQDAIKIASDFSLKHDIIDSEELDIPEFSQNPHNRCYYCKKELFSKLLNIAKKQGYDIVFDGNNLSDSSDYRPGRIAAKELGIVSPLDEAKLTKEDIRALSREYSLTTADKPAMACLSSRFPYGETITKEKLTRVEKSENFLRDLGFSQFRVRSHGDLARLEFIDTEIEKGFSQRDKIHKEIQSFGFVYCCIDMKGFRSGAMNEAIKVNLEQ